MTTREVEASLRDQGAPFCPPWLDVHDRYAGYVEPIGRDLAIWGLIHREPMFLDNLKVSVDLVANEWYAICADVHPSYRYELDSKGTFFGNPARSFDVKVERNSLIADFAARGTVRLLANELHEPSFAEQVRRNIASHLDEAASDAFSQYFMSAKYLIRMDAETGELVYGWELS